MPIAFNNGLSDTAPVACDLTMQAAQAGGIEDKIVADPLLNRTAVSYQGNKGLAGFRWFRFKEGFSSSLVEKCLLASGGRSVMDPFSGTAVMTACRMGRRSVGIDVMPIGERMAGAICAVAGRVSAADVRSASKDVLAYVAGGGERDRSVRAPPHNRQGVHAIH